MRILSNLIIYIKKATATFIVFCLLMVCGCSIESTGKDDGHCKNSDPPDASDISDDPNYDIDELVANGVNISEYTIIISDNATESAKYGAQELSSYIRKATGIELDVETDSEEPVEYEICIGETNRTPSGIFDSEELGDEGFYIRNIGEKLFIFASEINGGESRGVLYGVYSFLELLGYRFYTADCEKIPLSSDVFIPENVSVKQIPRFSYRDVTFKCSLGDSLGKNDAWCVKQKINGYFARNLSAKYGGCVEFAYGNQGLVHTMQYLVPKTLLEEHPEYFAYDETQGTRVATQICYTNNEVLGVVVQTAESWLQMYPKSEYISISHNDNGNFCKCSECKRSYATYGVSGTALRFVNAVANRIKADGYDQKVIFLAYNSTKELPKGGVVATDNVVVQLATYVCHNHGIVGDDCVVLNYKYEEVGVNDETRTELKGWGEISNSLILYNYVSNYYRYPMPFPNYNAEMINYNYYAKNTETEGVFSEGLGYTSVEFGELKAYLFAKMQWNPLMTEKEMWETIEDFCKGYYGGSSGKYIYDYIKLTVEKMGDNCIGDTQDLQFIMECGQNLRENMKFINKANELWDKAEMYCSDDVALERIERSRTQILFYELYTTSDELLKTATEKEATAIYTKNEQLYRKLSQYDALYIFGSWKLDEKFETKYHFKIALREFIRKAEGLT